MKKPKKVPRKQKRGILIYVTERQYETLLRAAEWDQRSVTSYVQVNALRSARSDLEIASTGFKPIRPLETNPEET